MADFYISKQRINRQLVQYMLHIQEKPEAWNPTEFEAFIRQLAQETGFSERTIYAELSKMGVVYDKQERILRKAVSAFEKVIKKEEGGVL
jgi:hypothetical protein